MITDEKTREKIACQATHLANELVRQLSAPSLILEDSETGPKKGNFLREGAIRNFCILGIIVNLYRVIELRENFLIDILFSEDELRGMGFLSIEDFLGGSQQMKYPEILRHQFAGHATAKWASVKKPGELIHAKLLGTALRETGIDKLREFASRLRDDCALQLERFVGQMREKFPAVDKFVTEDYPLELEKGRLGRRYTIVGHCIHEIQIAENPLFLPIQGRRHEKVKLSFSLPLLLQSGKVSPESYTGCLAVRSQNFRDFCSSTSPSPRSAWRLIKGRIS